MMKRIFTRTLMTKYDGFWHGSLTLACNVSVTDATSYNLNENLRNREECKESFWIFNGVEKWNTAHLIKSWFFKKNILNHERSRGFMSYCCSDGDLSFCCCHFVPLNAWSELAKVGDAILEIRFEEKYTSRGREAKAHEHSGITPEPENLCPARKHSKTQQFCWNFGWTFRLCFVASQKPSLHLPRGPLPTSFLSFFFSHSRVQPFLSFSLSNPISLFLLCLEHWKTVGFFFVNLDTLLSSPSSSFLTDNNLSSF
jgi:hypothetical protein